MMHHKRFLYYHFGLVLKREQNIKCASAATTPCSHNRIYKYIFFLSVSSAISLCPVAHSFVSLNLILPILPAFLPSAHLCPEKSSFIPLYFYIFSGFSDSEILPSASLYFLETLLSRPLLLCPSLLGTRSLKLF